MLDVGCDDVLDGAERGDFGLDIGREGDRGKDGEGAGGQLDDSAAAANFEVAETKEGDTEGSDIGCDIADYHDLGWVRGYETRGRFGGHLGSVPTMEASTSITTSDSEAGC